MDTKLPLRATSIGSDEKNCARTCRVRLPFLLIMALACLAFRNAAAEGEPQGLAAPQRSTASHSKRPSADDRVARLTKELDLNQTQQSELNKLLVSQREQVRRLWSDQSVPQEYRVSSMQAINDQTVARIRSLLNDEQKKKYFPPKPHDSAETVQKANLDEWLNATKPK